MPSKDDDICSLTSDSGHKLEYIKLQAHSDDAHVLLSCVYGIRLSGKGLSILYRRFIGSIYDLYQFS